jgi:hypothetical protein
MLIATTEGQRPPKMDSAWQQGADAFHAGLPASANPYQSDDPWDETSMDHNGWYNGYAWAYRRNKGIA